MPPPCSTARKRFPITAVNGFRHGKPPSAVDPPLAMAGYGRRVVHSRGGFAGTGFSVASCAAVNEPVVMARRLFMACDPLYLLASAAFGRAVSAAGDFFGSSAVSPTLSRATNSATPVRHDAGSAGTGGGIWHSQRVWAARLAGPVMPMAWP